jgi:hypothetical protein
MSPVIIILFSTTPLRWKIGYSRAVYDGGIRRSMCFIRHLVLYVDVRCIYFYRLTCAKLDVTSIDSRHHPLLGVQILLHKADSKYAPHGPLSTSRSLASSSFSTVLQPAAVATIEVPSADANKLIMTIVGRLALYLCNYSDLESDTVLLIPILHHYRRRGKPHKTW